MRIENFKEYTNNCYKSWERAVNISELENDFNGNQWVKRSYRIREDSKYEKI